MNMHEKTVVIIGGGAAGFFGAIACAEANPSARILLLEKHKQVLSKVKISGGGRCNVTHACFEINPLVQNYPRGAKELRSAFSRFQPQHTIDWFKKRGVELKTEADGRIFPVSDLSKTIISCFLKEVERLGIALQTERGIVDCHRENGFLLTLSNGEKLHCDFLLTAMGSSTKSFEWLKKLGHTFIPAVPSLFTFNIPNSPLHHLSGISIPRAKLLIEGSGFVQTGALLITHWGFSGPAVLKLSAFAARFLHEKKYQAVLKISWIPEISLEQFNSIIETYRKNHASRLLSAENPFELPKKLWKMLLEIAEISCETRWSGLSKKHLHDLEEILYHHRFTIEGKTTYKEEFVTCGGVNLAEVDFKTMQSKLCPGLYFAGEILDIDGVTGGFNFQNAWTTSWIAGNAIGKT